MRVNSTQTQDSNIESESYNAVVTPLRKAASYEPRIDKFIGSSP